MNVESQIEASGTLWIRLVVVLMIAAFIYSIPIRNTPLYTKAPVHLTTAIALRAPVSGRVVLYCNSTQRALLPHNFIRSPKAMLSQKCSDNG